MYLMVSNKKFMMGLTRHFVIAVPSISDDRGEIASYVESEHDTPGVPNLKGDFRTWDGLRHRFIVTVVYGEYPGIHVPAKGIANLSVRDASYLDIFTQHIIDAVNLCLEVEESAAQKEMESCLNSNA